MAERVDAMRHDERADLMATTMTTLIHRFRGRAGCARCGDQAKGGMGIWIALIILSVAGVVSCSRAAIDPATRVSEVLSAAKLGDIKVEYDRASATFRLKGVVADEIARNRALGLAIDAAGRTATILNELEIRRTDTAASTDDDRLKNEVRTRIDRDRIMRRRGINLMVIDGSIELTGTVASATEKNRAGRLAGSVSGITKVANHLVVKRPAQTSKTPRATKPPR